MITKYKALLLQTEGVEDYKRLALLTSLTRSILQTVTISIIEISAREVTSDPVGLNDLIVRMRKPVDGLSLEIIDLLLPLIRNEGHTGFLRGWFEKNQKGFTKSLSIEIKEWIEFRNSRLGHGHLDEGLAQEWGCRTSSLVSRMLDVFKDIIPDSNCYISHFNFKLTIPLIYQDYPIIISHVDCKVDNWKLRGQPIRLSESEAFTVNLLSDNIFALDSSKSLLGAYDIVPVMQGISEEVVIHNVPHRQTASFEGRVSEKEKIINWIIDGDARICLIFGDGGYGKTTLILEVLNSILEGEYELKGNLPEYICFYSAKMTQWTEQGLFYLTAIDPLKDDCVKEIVRSIGELANRDWHTISDKPLIDKLKGILVKKGISRDDILLVVDNTETLATSSTEVEELAKFLTDISKNLAKVIVTSRRRENIAAEPIQIEKLSVLEGVSLLRNLAMEYNARPLLDAGDSRVRKVVNQLMRKPLLIEAFVKYISHSRLGIDEALKEYSTRSDDELLEFLYDDAWLRMNDFQKKVFLILVKCESPLDDYVVGNACQLVGINISEFHKALEETHFTSQINYGRNYQLTIEELAERFFLKKLMSYDESEKADIGRISLDVDEHLKKKYRLEKDFKRDRVAEAFRNEFAKAAKIEADRNNISEAILFYDEAIKYDPLNSYLHDRYAWLLLNRTSNFLRALDLSKRAVELDSNNIDAIVGLALAYYRLGNLEDGDQNIDLAVSKGRAISYGLLRKAIARFHLGKKNEGTKVANTLYDVSLRLLEQAENRFQYNDGYDAKTRREIVLYKERVMKEINKIKFGYKN